ncbi:MAG: hypothetical protein FWC73_09805 [Defluviitaleaceae bacterium]|nr:hypothetical protein [Defluviitaleaceae bacterium]
MVYAFDANTVIHLMRNNLSAQSNLFSAKWDGVRFVIPPYTNYEIQRGLNIKPITR